MRFFATILFLWAFANATAYTANDGLNGLALYLTVVAMLAGTIALG